MILVDMRECSYSYEVEALVKNFYPHQIILSNSAKAAVSKEAAAERIKIELEESRIGISLYENEIPILDKSFCVTKEDTYKNQLKIGLYQVLSEHTRRDLDWGTLTGVRPVKLFMQLLFEGREEIAEKMKNSYLCSDEKIRLGYQIAKKEIKILSDIDYKNGYSIYIGIPFCPTTCLYCSFTSYSAEKYGAYIEAYQNALFKEIEYAKDCIKGKKLTTIYIGGGTPTTLSEVELARLLEKITNTFDFSSVKEFTVEAGRPDSITRGKLRVMKRYGVSRISINPQTMKEETLERIGRSHTVSKVKETFAMARQAGHDNINMDLIAGLPGEDLKDIARTLEAVKEMNPDSVTVHSLVTKRAARLNQEKERKIPRNVDEMTELCRKFLEKEGYQPYYMYRQKNAQGSGTGANQENIGYAREGKEGIYNILIMEEMQTILALGAGATSKFVFPEEDRMERIENVKSLNDYIGRIDEMIERKAAFLRKEGLNG